MSWYRSTWNWNAVHHLWFTCLPCDISHAYIHNGNGRANKWGRGRAKEWEWMVLRIFLFISKTCQLVEEFSVVLSACLNWRVFLFCCCQREFAVQHLQRVDTIEMVSMSAMARTRLPSTNALTNEWMFVVSIGFSENPISCMYKSTLTYCVALHTIIGIFHVQIEIYSFIRIRMDLMQRGKPNTSECWINAFDAWKHFHQNSFPFKLYTMVLRHTRALVPSNDIIKSNKPISLN